MATTTADLLGALGDAVNLSVGSGDPVDADRALVNVGVALQRLAADGLIAEGATERERWIAETGRACIRAAESQHATRTGRLAELSAAVVDTTSILREGLGCANRWALATAVVDVVHPLCRLVEQGDPSTERRQALIVADAAATVVQRTAALDPPSAIDSVPLDWAIPSPVTVIGATAPVRITNAAAGLEYATRPIGDSDAGLSVADYLAVCTALQTLSHNAVTVTGSHDPALRGSAQESERSWTAARAVLHPFDDGSRRPHASPPPAVRYAMSLHAALRNATGTPETRPEDDRLDQEVGDAVRSAVQRIPTIAGHLQGTVTAWAETGRLLAYARDFAPRDTRVREYLAGFRSAGLITADATDLAQARDALAGAHLLSIELATHTSEGAAGPSTLPRLRAANHDLHSQIGSERLSVATLNARRALAAHAGPPRGGRGIAR